MKNNYRLLVFVSVLFVIAPLCFATDEGLWMGNTYSVSLKFIGTEGEGIDSPVPNSEICLPAYPQKLMLAAVSGEAIVVFTVGTDGLVRNPVVESARFKQLEIAVIDAVAKWKFSPGFSRITKQVVPVRMRCKFMFQAEE